MQLHSEQGKGSTFSMYLPLDAKQIPVHSLNSDSSGDTLTTTVDQRPTDPGNESRMNFATETQVIADDRDCLDGSEPVLLIVEDDVQFARILLDMAHEKTIKQ